MLTTLLLLSSSLLGDVASKRANERIEMELAPCAANTVVRTTWLSDRRSTVRTTTNGQPMPSYATHDERHLDRAIEVLACRSGVPQKLRVKYGDAFVRRLDPEADPSMEEFAPGGAKYSNERSPLAGRAFEIAQVGEIAEVLTDAGAEAPVTLARLVLESEAVVGGAVPLPGDTVARALAAEARTRGTPFAFDASVARELLAGDETAQCAATFTFAGVERSASGRQQARFEARIVVHEEPEGGLMRDAELRGFLLADPKTGRPLEFEVDGAESKLAAASDRQNATEIEATGTWRVRRTWEWR